MKDQLFGIEIELTGISRRMVAGVIGEYLDSLPRHTGGYYDVYDIEDNQGRDWKVMYDSSIHAIRKYGDEEIDNYKVEVVSPICNYDDIETIQEIVRNIRKEGGRVNDSCGVHIHINASPHTAKTLKNFVNIMASKEELLYKALQVDKNRVDTYCGKVDDDFVKRLNSSKRLTMDEFKSQWYSDYRNPDLEATVHYSNTRYKGLNLHSVFYKGTIEARFFNSTLHAGEVKSYIQLCLAISHQALTQKSARFTKTTSTNEKYTFRTWLLRLGFIGDEFKTARLHLLKNLDGCIAWKTEEQKNAQVERLREARNTEVQTLENEVNELAETQIQQSDINIEETEVEAEETEAYEMTM